MSAIQLLKWLLNSLNTDKLCSASADVASRVHANTSKIRMFGKESGSPDTKDFIKVSGKSTLSEWLDHILNHLDTSLSNDLGVSRSSCHDSYWSGGGIPSLRIKDGIRLNKAVTGQQLPAEKRFCNCCSKTSFHTMTRCIVAIPLTSGQTCGLTIWLKVQKTSPVRFGNGENIMFMYLKIDTYSFLEQSILSSKLSMVYGTNSSNDDDDIFAILSNVSYVIHHLFLINIIGYTLTTCFYNENCA